jgi:hypothetical protein
MNVPTNGGPVNASADDIEERLRDAYRAAARTIPPEAVNGLHERVVRVAPVGPPAAGGRARRLVTGRVLLPLAAAAAVVAAAVLVPAFESGLLAGHGGAAPRPGGGPGAAIPSAVPRHTAHATKSGKPDQTLAVPPGAPAFFFASDGGPGTTLYVYSTATARAVARITPPHPGDTFDGIAATSNPLRFVVATGHTYSCGTRLYTLRLSADGQPAGYTPMAVPSLPEDLISLAATLDGRYLAYAGDECGGTGGQGDIGLVNMSTGAISGWTAPKQEDIGSLSVSDKGTEIAFTVGQTKLFDAEAGLLATDAPSGTLAQSAQVIVSGTQLRPAGTVPEGAALSPDGRTMYVCGSGVSVGNAPPPATPDPLLTFTRGTLTRTAHLGGAGSCGLSLDPSGNFLLAQTSGGYSTTSTPTLQLIDLATGKATTVPVPAANLPDGAQVSW